MKIQVICNYCGWKGRTKQLNGIRCPKCDNGKYIVDAEPEYEPDNIVIGGGKFNWNRK